VTAPVTIRPLSDLHSGLYGDDIRCETNERDQVQVIKRTSSVSECCDPAERGGFAAVTASAVTASTLMLATLQQAQSGVYIAAAEPKAGSFTITLTKAATADLPVGWFFIG
jgi:hypothetical protein